MILERSRCKRCKRPSASAEYSLHGLCLECASMAPVTDRTTEPLGGVERGLKLASQDSMGSPRDGVKSDSKPSR